MNEPNSIRGVSAHGVSPGYGLCCECTNDGNTFMQGGKLHIPADSLTESRVVILSACSTGLLVRY
jgi:hypothetical protein